MHKVPHETKECSRCLLTDDVVEITNANGQCEYCDLHDRMERQSDPREWARTLKKMQAAKGRYNCLIGISGGLDSATLLYMAVKRWGLRPMVMHFDNGWNTPEAKSNIQNLCAHLNVPLTTYHPAPQEYDLLNVAFLKAGVPDADIPNDIAMTKLMYEAADRHGIKWILNGHDFRTEGSTPAKWTYMDARYIASVYANMTGGMALHHYPLFTFIDQIIYGLKGIKQARPFYYINDRERWETEMKARIDWADYGAKHAENIYTEYVGAKLLPEKFGIDKRLVYLSARIRSNELTKTQARQRLHNDTAFNMSRLGASAESIAEAAKSPITAREAFDRYDFKAPMARAVVWLLAKAKVVPWTFYRKYCC